MQSNQALVGGLNASQRTSIEKHILGNVHGALGLRDYRPPNVEEVSDTERSDGPHHLDEEGSSVIDEGQHSDVERPQQKLASQKRKATGLPKKSRKAAKTSMSGGPSKSVKKANKGKDIAKGGPVSGGSKKPPKQAQTPKPGKIPQWKKTAIGLLRRLKTRTDADVAEVRRVICMLNADLAVFPKKTDDRSDENDALIARAELFAHRIQPSGLLQEFEKFLLCCMFRLLKDKGVSNKRIFPLMKIAGITKGETAEHLERLLKGVVWANTLVHDLWLKGWGLRGTELVVFCK